MKFTIKSAFTLAALAMFSASPAMADVQSVKDVQLSEFTPFGVSQNSDLEALGCVVFEDDLYECTRFPEKNSVFNSYTVETRSGPRDGICNVTAYSQIFRGDYSGDQVRRAYDRLGLLLERKYGVATKTNEDLIEGKPDHVASAIMLGTKVINKEWSDKDSTLPHGTSITMKVVATSAEKTFVELNYFLGGPGCSTEDDQAIRGL